MIEAVQGAVSDALAFYEGEKDMCQASVDRLTAQLEAAKDRLAQHRQRIADLREFLSVPRSYAAIVPEDLERSTFYSVSVDLSREAAR